MFKWLLLLSLATLLLFTALISLISREWTPTQNPAALILQIQFEDIGRTGFVVDAGFTRITPLGADARRLSNPVCSADGERLAYSEQDSLYIHAADGTLIDTYQIEGLGYAGVSLSSAADTIAYSGQGGEVWIGDLTTGESAQRTGLALIERSPAISPDGKWIIYEGGGQGFRYNYDLWLAPIDGSTPARLIAHGMTPAWSPDSSMIVYSAITTSNNYELHLLDIAHQVNFRITHTRGYDLRAAWTPDGSQIAFTTSRNGAPELYIMRADGRDARPLALIGSILKICFLNQTPVALVGAN